MTNRQKKNLYRILTAAALTVTAGLLPLEGGLRGAAFLIPYIIVGYDIWKKALLGIRNGQVFDENFLMTIATVGAIVLGEYAEGVAVMLFYQIGELFQSVAVGKSRKNISLLMDIRPDYANLEREDGGLERVDPEEVETGTILVVRPGEKIPIDGVVVEGSSDLDTGALTGESLPRAVGREDGVISGCINLTGLLRIRTTKRFEESTVSRILELVEHSSMKKSRSEEFITRFARYYTPFVCLGALLVALIPPLALLVMGREPAFSMWLIRALTFLVISCPCALVISIPLSFFGGIGGASARGILVKGSNYLEALAKTDCVVFDKTGTLTKGTFEVREVVCAGELDEAALLKYAAYAESYSSHPISKSLREAYGGAIDRTRLTEVTEVGGMGVTALVDGVRVAAGNERLMRKEGAVPETADKAGTIVYVSVNGVYEGYILIADSLKPQAQRAVEALRAEGVERLVMLTGDNEKAAQEAAAVLGIREVMSGLLPEDKVSAVEKLLEGRRKGRILAFVGDGVNDAPVLTRADIGIAMGAMGSDAAIEAADVVLMDDDPLKIAQAMRISGKCMRIVYQNIVFALGIKGLCLLLGPLGLVNMWMAIFADVGVMVLAVLNAMRCLQTKDCIRDRSRAPWGSDMPQTDRIHAA